MNLTLWALLCGWVALCAAVGVPKNERGKVLRSQNFLEIFSNIFACRDQDLSLSIRPLLNRSCLHTAGALIGGDWALEEKGSGVKSFGSRRLQGSSVV
ncbi:hypothetical protein TNIN_241281 [Trichonephila inaurata madagascariensis]|uniref:Secreted protein n=1 Tax=Trichonephila inaurata madagascariensis TaxID=2747483 RepID=A0A8X6XA57_9ARAC|nr:hypothetical protein TNIN_241281 [Trichonephila inaurata madagascariensis]